MESVYLEAITSWSFQSRPPIIRLGRPSPLGADMGYASRLGAVHKWAGYFVYFVNDWETVFKDEIIGGKWFWCLPYARSCVLCDAMVRSFVLAD